MNGQWIVAAGLVWAVAGCQSAQQTTTLPPSPTRAVPAPATAPAVDPRVAEAIRQADEQAKVIEQVPVTRIKDLKPATAPEPSKAPGVGAVESAIAGMPGGKPTKPADDGFRPVPAIVGPDGKPFQAAIVPPTVETPAPTANTPTITEPPPTVDLTPPAQPKPAAIAGNAAADPLGQQLAKRAREYPRDLGPQLEDQVYRLLNGERVPTTDAMAGLSLEDRDVLTSVLDGLANFRGDINRDPNLLVTRKIRPLLQMADRLRTRADMSIVNANFCRKVDGFGKFDAIIPAKLKAGAANRVSLYYEVENLNPRLDVNNMWVTMLQQDLVLYDDAGQPQWSRLGSRVKDDCRNRRRDFFLNSPIEFPATLKAGDYTLKITLNDTGSGRVIEHSVPVSFSAAVPANNMAPGPVGPVFNNR